MENGYQLYEIKQCIGIMLAMTILKPDLSEKTFAEIAAHYGASIAEAVELIYRDTLELSCR
jgi:cytochrome c553